MWDLVPLPPGVCPITAKWVFKIKPSSLPTTPPIFTARIVARGNEQVHGINFQETFAPSVLWESIHYIISLTAYLCWPMNQLDVVTTFLNGNLDDPIFLTQPPGDVVFGKGHLVCRLQKSLYGLRQSHHVWYSKIDSFLHIKGLRRTTVDSNVYYSRTPSSIITQLLYVDDLILTDNNPCQLSALQ